MLDLHTHSTYSDGSDTPDELAARAAQIGLRAIALTDHDTTASHEAMRAACERVGIEHVGGLEVSLRDNEFPKDRGGRLGARNVHVLAYFPPLDPDHPLQRELAALRVDRETRNAELVALLRANGFTRLTLDYLVGLSGRLESIGRPHVARAMAELHPEIVGAPSDATTQRVFTEWLGASGRAYIPKTSIAIERFVEAGRGSGVVFAIAHPLDNYLDAPGDLERTMPRVLASLRERGVVGVEAHYGSSPRETREEMVRLTRAARMIPTGGSDYHGTYKGGVALGRGLRGDLEVPDGVLEELKAAR
ncbi:MAG: PHP domain-containing protein [Acidimicrobiales bacterium]